MRHGKSLAFYGSETAEAQTDMVLCEKELICQDEGNAKRYWSMNLMDQKPTFGSLNQLLNDPSFSSKPNGTDEIQEELGMSHIDRMLNGAEWYS